MNCRFNHARLRVRKPRTEKFVQHSCPCYLLGHLCGNPLFFHYRFHALNGGLMIGASVEIKDLNLHRFFPFDQRAFRVQLCHMRHFKPDVLHFKSKLRTMVRKQGKSLCAAI
jgi:hypothetical protein